MEKNDKVERVLAVSNFMADRVKQLSYYVISAKTKDELDKIMTDFRLEIDSLSDKIYEFAVEELQPVKKI
jgi:hypothetical protein